MNIFGTHDEKTLAQLAQVKTNAAAVALMADGHLGYIMPVGGVAAYRGLASVPAVGYDIACGNAAIKTDAKAEDFALHELHEIADDIAAHISFGVGRKNVADDAPTDHLLFTSADWSRIPNSERNKLRDKARAQLGTVGSGNHYVDVFADEEGYIWVGVHFGSRGFGHTIASNFLSLGQGGKWGERAPEREVLLSLDDALGQDYWALMELCGEYAYAGREWVARKVVSMLGAHETDLVHNHHNFAWKETHTVDCRIGPEELIVVRKGATPAFPGQRGFVGGSMGDNAVILEGTDATHGFMDSMPNGIADWDRADEVNALQTRALYSTVHGAGRVMSRTEAAGKWDYKKKVRKTEGKISPEMMNSWIAERGVILRGGGLDEAPQAYRRLPEVLHAQGDTINVLHTLTPLIVVMAGAGEHDPYKD